MAIAKFATVGSAEAGTDTTVVALPIEVIGPVRFALVVTVDAAIAALQPKPVFVVQLSALPDVLQDGTASAASVVLEAAPWTVFCVCAAEVAVSVPLVVTADDGVELRTSPSPVKVTLETVALDVLQVAQVIFPVVPVMVKGLLAVTTGTPLALPIVHVGLFEFVIVMPLMDDGVMAPKVNVNAGVVVAFATEQDTPLAVTQETDVTVLMLGLFIPPAITSALHNTNNNESHLVITYSRLT